MDVAASVVAVLVLIAGGLAGVFSFTDHRDLAIWMSCLMINFAIVGAFLWYQGHVWTRDESIAREQKSRETADEQLKPTGLLIPSDGVTPDTSQIDPKLFARVRVRFLCAQPQTIWRESDAMAASPDQSNKTVTD